MAAAPEDVLFPLTTALVLGALAFLIVKRSASLSGAGASFALAFVFGALALLAALAGALGDWNEGGEAAVAAGASAACVAFVAPLASLGGRPAGRVMGSVGFQKLTWGAALGISALGWGALAGARLVPGDGRIDGWVRWPVTLAVSVLVLISLLTTRRLFRRGATSGPFLLFGGVLLYAGGLLTIALGQSLAGSALVMMGGGLVYTAAPAVASLAGAAAPRAFRPRASQREPERPAAGVKVLIPKGGAVRVSSYSDDDPPSRTRE